MVKVLCNICGSVLHDVLHVVVWPGLCDNVAPGYTHKFTFQYPAQGGQKRATFCSQQCCNMLRANAAIVWPQQTTIK